MNILFDSDMFFTRQLKSRPSSRSLSTTGDYTESSSGRSSRRNSMRLTQSEDWEHDSDASSARGDPDDLFEGSDEDMSGTVKKKKWVIALFGHYIAKIYREKYRNRKFFTIFIPSKTLISECFLIIDVQNTVAKTNTILFAERNRLSLLPSRSNRSTKKSIQ